MKILEMIVITQVVTRKVRKIALQQAVIVAVKKTPPVKLVT